MNPYSWQAFPVGYGKTSANTSRFAKPHQRPQTKACDVVASQGVPAIQQGTCCMAPIHRAGKVAVLVSQRIAAAMIRAARTRLAPLLTSAQPPRHCLGPGPWRRRGLPVATLARSAQERPIGVHGHPRHGSRQRAPERSAPVVPNCRPTDPLQQAVVNGKGLAPKQARRSIESATLGPCSASYPHP